MLKGLFCCLVISTLLSYAQISYSSPQSNSTRSGKWEGSFRVNYLRGDDVNGRGASKLDIDSGVGGGITLGYHINDSLLINTSFDFASLDYAPTFSSVDGTEPDVSRSADLDIMTTNINAVYHLTPQKLTPFVQAGIGWSYIDSNVAEGLTSLSCWWDPWWGQVCPGLQQTYDDTRLSYNIGVGVRYEFSRNAFVRVNYLQRWIDLVRASTIDSGIVQFEIGATF
jgi:opacity protein-like surface antigen